MQPSRRFRDAPSYDTRKGQGVNLCDARPLMGRIAPSAQRSAGGHAVAQEQKPTTGEATPTSFVVSRVVNRYPVQRVIDKLRV